MFTNEEIYFINFDRLATDYIIHDLNINITNASFKIEGSGFLRNGIKASLCKAKPSFI